MENKPLTNMEKLKEIFPNVDEEQIYVLCPATIVKSLEKDCKSKRCNGCCLDFWNAPYEEPKEG